MKILLIMYVLLSEVTIGPYVFRQINDVEIEKSWRSLENTCVIKLANLPGTSFQKTLLEEKLTTGLPVNVKLWYMNEPAHVEFEGYISRVGATIPFEVYCEDEVYWFKRTPIKKTWKESVKLTEVVKYLVDQVNAKYPNVNITLSGNLPFVRFDDGFVIQSGNTAATALQKIKENFGLVSYFRGKELFTGLSQQQNFGRVKHSLAWNVIDNDLVFHRADDVRIRIKPVGFTLDNKKVTTQEVGDPDGELRTVHYYNVKTEEQLLKLAENDLLKYKYEGYEGSMQTFLIPYCEPLMSCELFDPRYNGARSGTYQIDSVKVTFGQDGARRVVELGNKLSV